ncbi:MAG TPA: Uma2 family endonuclease [Pseudonocardiaceae bacterium]|nr:Uma2 family endonuclease [Pseudonocardiaceae bacterium]
MTETNAPFVDDEVSTRYKQAFLLVFTRLVWACPAELYTLEDLERIELHFNAKLDPEVRPSIVVAPIPADSHVPPGIPVLAVDVLYPGDDLPAQEARKRCCARFGVGSYWVVDPFEPSLTAFELDDKGQYRTTARVSRDEPFETTSPFPARVVLTEPVWSRDEEDDC